MILGDIVRPASRRALSALTTPARAALVCIVAAGTWSCARSENPEDAAAAPRATEMRDTMSPAQESQATADASLQPGLLKTVAGATVQGRTGPGGRSFEVARRTPDPAPGYARQFGSITLGLALRTRTPDLSQYPCTSCHMGARLMLSAQRVPDAHQNIQPVHPAESGATCGTCHAAENVELLAFRSGERITMDHAYRVCAQCHSTQVTEWAGGAHGKRLDGWQGRRVVMGCAACHDPHQPALQPRTPFRAPQIPRKGRHQP